MAAADTSPHPAAAAARLITCILPAGEGFELATALYEQLGLTAADVTHGRGASQRSGTFADEMDVLTVVVAAARADEVFEYIYHEVDMGERPNRFMYQQRLEGATEYRLPELPHPETGGA
ncbi:MAG: hypothetical protein ACU85V_14390 [Gammaproteobacteria bacterium]